MPLGAELRQETMESPPQMRTSTRPYPSTHHMPESDDLSNRVRCPNALVPPCFVLLWRLSRRTLCVCIEFGAKLKDVGSWFLFLFKSVFSGLFPFRECSETALILGYVSSGASDSSGLCSASYSYVCSKAQLHFDCAITQSARGMSGSNSSTDPVQGRSTNARHSQNQLVSLPSLSVVRAQKLFQVCLISWTDLTFN